MTFCTGLCVPPYTSIEERQRVRRQELLLPSLEGYSEFFFRRRGAPAVNFFVPLRSRPDQASKGLSESGTLVPGLANGR